MTSAEVNIISDIVVCPQHQSSPKILESCLSNGVKKDHLGKRCAASPSGELLNLLDGLGDDFMYEEQTQQDLNVQIPQDLNVLDGVLVQNILDGVLAEGVITTDPIMVNIEDDDVMQVENVDPPRPMTPTPQTSMTLPQAEEKGEPPQRTSTYEIQDSLSCSQLSCFSQPDHKMAIQNFRNLYNEVANKKKKYEFLRGESQRQIRSAMRLRDEAEVHQKKDEDRLKGLFKELENLKKAVAKQRQGCRLNEKNVKSLKSKEKEITVLDQHNKNQVEKYRKKLNSLQSICGSPGIINNISE